MLQSGIQFSYSTRILRYACNMKKEVYNKGTEGRKGKQSYFLTSKTLYFLFCREKSLEAKPRGKLSILYPPCDSTQTPSLPLSVSPYTITRKPCYIHLLLLPAALFIRADRVNTRFDIDISKAGKVYTSCHSILFPPLFLYHDHSSPIVSYVLRVRRKTSALERTITL